VNEFITTLKVPIFKTKSIYTEYKGYLNKADIYLNEKILNILRKNFPEDLIISEETNLKKHNNVKNLYVWIIDPLCGTTNYTHQIPLYSFSISLNYNGIHVFSFIKNLNNNDIYFSYKKKSYINNKKISVSKIKKLNEALILVNCNQSDHKKIQKYFIKLIKLISPPVSRRIHIYESANLELSYVASGKADAYINFQDNIWDINAGINLVNNAGGFATKISNNEIKDIGVLASNKFLFRKLKNIIKNI